MGHNDSRFTKKKSFDTGSGLRFLLERPLARPCYHSDSTKTLNKGGWVLLTKKEPIQGVYLTDS